VSKWHDLVTASLIGTERTVVPAVAIPGLAPAEDDAGDPAAALLDRAALMTAARRAGRRPDTAEPLPRCEPDLRPLVSPSAAVRLMAILNGEHPELLTEWLTAAAARGLRPPSQLLPALLDRARQPRPTELGLIRLVAEAGGPRTKWLAGLNPDWKSVAAPDLTGDDVWRLGDTGQRRGYLAGLAARDPEAAWELVGTSWDAAGRVDRGMFLAVMTARASRLGAAAEPLLEAALDDRAVEVRAGAAYLLPRLPGSALGQRMAERALACVRIEDSVRGPHLLITPPSQCDDSMRRDGIVAGPAAELAQPTGRAHLLYAMVARTPLRTWTDAFGLTATQVVALSSGDWAQVLFAGWTRAAIAQRDRQWTAALVGHALTGRSPRMRGEIEALEQLARQVDPALVALDTLPEPGPDARPAIRAALGVLRFRYDMLKELDDDRDHG
jgi:hypothetical protein